MENVIRSHYSDRHTCYIIIAISLPYISIIPCEISGSHDIKYSDGCLLGSCTEWSGRFTDIPEILAASIIKVNVITLKTEAACTSET
jgi:hypothetical protein